MGVPVIEKPHMIVKRDIFLEKAFELFSAKGITPVSMQDVADASGYGVATLYRYFGTKPILVIAVAAWKWEAFRAENVPKISDTEREKMTASENYRVFLDAFLSMYRNDRRLLRFNQFFNIYIESEQIDQESLKPYQDIIMAVRKQFHAIYVNGQSDHTLRTDISEEEIFSTTLHLMLAAVTRYAVGLVYKPATGFDPVREIELLKEMFLDRYTMAGNVS